MLRVVAALGVAAVTAAAVAVTGSAKSNPGEIVFVAGATPAHPHAVFAVHPDGKALRRLPVGATRAAFWSPSGKRVAMVGRTLTLRNANGHRKVTVMKCGAGCDVAWAPGSQRLVFTKSTRCGHPGCPSTLGVVGANGKGRRTLLRFAGARVSSPSWSPDGSLIAFIETAGGVADLDVVHPNGRGFTRLAPADGASYYPQYHPSWTAASSTIFFSARRAGVTRVLSVSRDARTLRTLAAGKFPVVSPDGKRVAFVRKGSAYVMPVRGGTVRKIASGVTSSLAWSPDGTRLAFATSANRIAVARANGGGSTSVTGAYRNLATVGWRAL